MDFLEDEEEETRELNAALAKAARLQRELNEVLEENGDLLNERSDLLKKIDFLNRKIFQYKKFVKIADEVKELAKGKGRPNVKMKEYNIQRQALDTTEEE